jgi:hypothetical protein
MERIFEFRNQRHSVPSGGVISAMVQQFNMKLQFLFKLAILFGSTVLFLVESGQTLELRKMLSFLLWTKVRCMWQTKDMSMEMAVLSLRMHLVVCGGIRCLL